MKRNLSIQLKALFLLLVFATNTVVGFACGLGVDLGSNAPHHSKSKKIASVHIHGNDGNHIHGEKPIAVNVHVHKDGRSHSHDSKPKKQKLADGINSPTKEAGGCCSNKVQQFQQIDKNITANSSINLPVFAAILHTFLAIDFSKAIKEFPSKYNIRLYYPSPPSIRIAIQRFQI